MTTSDYTKSIIALACWRAAQNETYQVMMYIGMVFRNRALAGWFEEDLYENCWQWLIDNPGPFPDVRAPQFQKLLVNIDTLTSNLVSDKTDGALWFAPLSETEQVVGKITTTVGKIIFVR